MRRATELEYFRESELLTQQIEANALATAANGNFVCSFSIHTARGIETVHRQDSSTTRILKTVHRQN